MKKLLSAALLFILLPVLVHGQQNIVFNPSFEQNTNTSCSSGIARVTQYCTGWYTFASTPDYLQICSNLVPSNNFGYQWPASGSAHIGLWDFNAATTYGYRESIRGTMTPMVPGATYEVSLSVSVADKSKYFTNGLCVHFFDTGLTTIPSFTAAPPFTPSVSFASSGQITDTQGWVRLSALFVADSAYDNIAIGGFLDTGNISYSNTNITPNVGYVYWYIDSVVVKLADTLYCKVNDSLFCAGDTFSMQYFLVNKYNSTNIFTAQLSNAAGSFSSPTNIGSTTSDTSGIISCTIPSNISPGNGYRVRVIASSPGDTSSNASPVIKIGNPDSTNINTSSNSPLCEGSILQLSASTFVSGTTYTWTGPANFSSSSASPSIAGVLPAQNGDYIVAIKWYGCEVKDTLPVTVKPLPATPVVGSNSPICAGETLNLTATTSTSGVSWSWIGPGSYSSTSQNPSVNNTNVAMSGVYTATATLNGCSVADTVHVLVKPSPTPASASSNSPVCAGDTLHITIGTSTTGVSYSWAGPNSFSANTQNTYVAGSTTAASGWYVATLNLNGCLHKDSTQATVHPIPATPAVSYSNPMCVGETLQLNATTVNNATYNWTGVGNYSSTLQNPTRGNMQFGDTGTYSVTATINGCTSPAGQVKVYINPVPFVVIFPTPGDSICVGEQASFTALPNNHGGTPAYQWRINGVPVGGNATSYSSTTLNHSDVVRVDMTENTKCRSNYVDASNEVEMKVLPWLAPSVSISASPNRPLNVDEYVTFTATTTNAGNFPKFQWKRNGQDVQGATGPVWSANTLNDNDSISVEIISNYRCPQPTNAVSNGIRVKVLTGVGDVNQHSKLSLYPNPNNGKFILKGKINSDEGVKIEVFNALGQIMYRTEVETADGELHTEISMHETSAGVYMLKLYSDNGIEVIRFSVQ
jgi:hypothetical protein